MRHLPESSNLAWLPWLLVAITVVGAWYLRRRAPAVALGLAGALIGGFIGHHIAHEGRVPSHVSGLAVIGLLVFGVIGLVFDPAPASAHRFRATGLALVGGAIAVAMTWTVMHNYTCYYYDPPTRRWCGGVDLFYGISGKVTMEVAVGAFVLVCLFLASALKAEETLTDPWFQDDPAFPQS